MSELDRRKDEFLATLAHGLRNPLAPIRNAVEILKVGGLDEADRAWNRDLIDRQVRQMARLLDDLLDVARITRGKLDLRRQRVALSEVPDAAVETSRPPIDAGHHRLTVALPPASTPRTRTRSAWPRSSPTC
jgi:signal transduction histidine kinase